MLLSVEERHKARQEDAVRTLWWEEGAVCLIDQTKLPQEQVVVSCSTVAEVAAAIRSMVVRGAPAIGVTAAYGMALAALKSTADDTGDLLDAPAGRPAPALRRRLYCLWDWRRGPSRAAIRVVRGSDRSSPPSGHLPGSVASQAPGIPARSPGCGCGAASRRTRRARCSRTGTFPRPRPAP